ncbi:MAG: pimeloyl-ACP methyl ester carboxylesterase [Halieaceae bacterium]|jgi:pimeloyl-ACP methyl ester carboxylesterase
MESALNIPHGPLRFSARSLGEGPLVLLLHGFPDNASTWQEQLPALAEAGYRAVAVTLRGYETKSRPADGDYGPRALADDVLACIDFFGEERAHLVGHDWGASIAHQTGGLFPKRLRSLTALSVPHAGRFVAEITRHPKQLRLSWYMLFFQLRGLSERVIVRKDYAFIRMLWRQWSPGWDAPEEHLQDVIETLRQPGVLTSALTYYRNALSPGTLPLSGAARKSARFKISVPTLAVTGERDGCIDPAVFQSMMYPEDYPQGLQVEQIADAGHFPHMEQPAQFNALLLDWLRRHP